MSSASEHPKMVPPPGCSALHVLVIGRVSKPTQAIENIEAGYRYAEQVLPQVTDGPVEIRYLGEQGSGLLVERKTILEAYELIEAGWPHVVLMEDSSKSYRNPRFIYAFWQDCFDADVRAIAPGDQVDTWDDNWELMLGAAAFRHGMHIPDTRRRIRRTATHSFHAGGMVMKVRFGYRKVSKEDAASGKFGPIGLKIAKVDEWTPLIRDLRMNVVRDGLYGQGLVDWLKEQRGADGKPVPTGPYSKRTDWCWPALLSLLRDPILYGWRQFRKVTHKTLFKTGKSRRLKNAKPESEVCPSIAHMTKEEFDELQRALDDLAADFDRSKQGEANPRYQVPRCQTVSPRQHLRCLCGAFLHDVGKGNLKCSRALERGEDSCWNHVQVSCELAREALVDALLSRVNRHPMAKAALLDTAWNQVCASRGRADDTTKSVEGAVADLTVQAARIADAIAAGGDLPALVEKSKAINESLQQAIARRGKTGARLKDKRWPTSRSQLDAIEPREALLELARTSFEFANLMRRLFPRFVLQPVQALDSGLVRPRALLTLDLSSLLPKDYFGEKPEPESFEVNLFEPPEHIKHLRAVVELKRCKAAVNEKASLHVLATELKIGRMTVKRALAYHNQIEVEGLTEPYRVLASPPVMASRWHSRDEGRQLRHTA